MLEAADAALLADLERRLDARAFRAAAHLAARWQNRKRAPRPETSAAFAPGTVSNPLAVLKQAMAAGALESAAQLLEQVLQSSESFEGSASALALVIETMLMLGQRERAQVLGAKHAATLGTIAGGVAMLELIGSDAAADVLPGGRPHLLRLSRRLERRELDAAGLIRVFATQPFALLRSPELHLLFFSALVASEPDRALGFLNRFLAAQGTPPARWNGDADNVLARLSFAAPPRTPTAGPLVSVLVPAHNAAATIGYAVDSLLSQSYAALEVLVGDDASDDATLEVLRSRAASDPRLRLFSSTRNQGPYNLKNALATHARGELITFHDADDLALPDRIERQVSQMQSPDHVACVANFARIRPQGAFVFFKDQRAVRLGLVTLMLTRRALAAAGPFRSARVGADLELYHAVRAHFGDDAIARVRAPVMLGLWSAGSATLGAGTESLEDGYRSPARRAYSQLVFEQHARDRQHPSSAEIEARLRETQNYAEPASLDAVT